MLRHLVTIAIRNILKHLNYSILNIVGLAIGITSFLFILIYVTDELKYDRFHENHEQIFRMNRLYNSNNIHEDAATVSFPFGPALADDYPDMIKSTVRFFDFQVSKMLFENLEDSTNVLKFNEKWFYMADSNVFQMFTFPFVEGDPATALNRPFTIVLTESTAKKYFGDKPAIGKTLRMEEQFIFEVTGIMKDLPKQSHFKIDMLASLSTYRALGGGQLPQTWIWNPCWTYVQLRKNVTREQVESQLADFHLRQYADFKDQEITLYMQPLTDIHLNSHHDYEMHPNGKLSYIRILSLIGVFVLILACINFMNLATASSAGRGREIGMKKVAGAKRVQLQAQFLGESLIITFFAVLLSAILIELLLPAFNNFTGKSVDTGLVIHPVSMAIGLALLLVVGLSSGFYPAFYLSRLDTSHLKGALTTGAGKGLARKILVVVQFFISVALIIGTISAFSQLHYLRNADLGFNRDQVILLPTKFNTALHFDRFAEELRKHNQVVSVTGMEDILGANHNTRQVVIEGMFDDQPFWYPAFLVRYDFIETFNIPVVEGRAFSRDFPSDTSEAIMINESMVRHLGWTNEEAIGKVIRMDGHERVIGVFSDFNALSLHKPAGNFILDMLENPRFAAAQTRYIAIKVNTDNYKEVLGYIQKIWEEISPTRPFEYTFLDEELNALYKDESSFSRLSIILTILAIVIACLGIIGLTSFMVEKKTKEISVRRIHGATTAQVNTILSREFIWLILIANMISWPIAYLAILRWLQNFSKHIEIQWSHFLISALVTIFITIIITSIHAYRASRMNPADTLKYE